MITLLRITLLRILSAASMNLLWRRTTVCFLFVAIALGFANIAIGQDTQSYLLQTGTPSFSTADSFPSGFVNLSNGNVHLELVLGQYPQRGGRAYEVKLVYDSKIWRTFNSGSSKLWNSSYNQVAEAAGWTFSTGNLISTTHGGSDVNWATNSPTCAGGTKWDNVYGPFFWVSPDNTQHVFPITTKQNYQCGGPVNTGGDAYALDGSGYHMFVNTATGIPSQGTITLFDKHGGKINLFSPPATNQIKDSNGNFVNEDAGTVSGFSSVDLLGRTIVSTSPGTWWYGSAWINGIKLPNSSNQTSSFQPTVTAAHGNTGFGASGVTEYSNWTLQLLQSLQLPDGTSYQFTYDCDSSSGVTACGSPAGQPGYSGQLIGMTLPTGGTVSFTYNTFLDANSNPSSWAASRTVGGNSWTYLPSATCGAGCQTMTVTQPNGSQQLYTFTLNQGNGSWATSAQYYSGTVGSTLLSAVQNNYSSQPAAADVGGFAYTLPSTITTTMPAPAGSLIKQTTFSYDSYNYTYEGVVYHGSNGKLLSKTESAYGIGTAGSALRKTVNTYLDDSNSNYRSKNLLDLVSDSQIQDGAGNKKAETKITYDSGSLTSLAGIQGHDDTNFGTSYTFRGNPTSIQKLVAGTTFLTVASLTYDTTGQVKQVSDSASHATTLSYADNFFNESTTYQNPPPAFTPTKPTNAYLTQINSPLIGVSNFGYYYGTGKQTLARDQNGADYYLHYIDSMDRLTHTFQPSTNGNRGWSLNVYAGSGLQVDSYASITDTTPSASCSSCRHDQQFLDILGRPTQKILASDPDGASKVLTAYDGTGRVQSVSTPYRSPSDPTYGLESRTYDAINRTTKITHADGQFAQTFYGTGVTSTGAGGLAAQLCSSATYGVGYPILAVSELGKKRQTWTDALGRLVEVDEPDSTGTLVTPTCYAYDVLDNLTQTVQGSQTRTYAYDGLSRPISSTTPETGVTTIYYTTSAGAQCSGDPGSICRLTDARGITATCLYDSLNRLTSKSYSNGDPTLSLFYDQTTYNGLSITFGKGRQTGMSDASGATAWSYDAKGRVLVERRTISGITKSTTYSYNLDDSVSSVTYPSGHIFNYAYSNAQRPISANQGTTNYASAATYAPQGALASVVHGQISGGFSGITESYSYNNRLQINSILAASSAGTVLNLSYNFVQAAGNNGNVASITNNRDTSRTQTFGYDNLDRISTAQSQATSGTNCWGLTVGVDVINNLLSETPTKCSAYPLSVAVNTKNQVTNTGFTYDVSGNLTGDGSLVYVYDAESRIKSAAGVTYTYDGNNLRVKKSTGFLYWRDANGNVVAETDLAGNTVNEYVFFSGRRIARIDSTNAVTFSFVDHLNNTRIITNATGSVCYEGDFYPYGREIVLTNTCPQNYKFGGWERDSETGLDYAIARYYSSGLGRFLSVDLVDGSPINPQSWNGYSYARNNSLNMVDPSGMDPVDGIFSTTGGDFPSSGTTSLGGFTFSWSISSSGLPSWSNINFGNSGAVLQPGGGYGTAGIPGMLNQLMQSYAVLYSLQTFGEWKGGTYSPPRDSILPSGGWPVFTSPKAPSSFSPALGDQQPHSFWDGICDSSFCMSAFSGVSNFSAGAGDVLSFGVTYVTRKYVTHSDSVVDKGGFAYAGGAVTGVVISAAFGGTAAAVADGKNGALFGRGTQTMFNSAKVRFGWGWQGSAKAGRDVIRLGIGAARGTSWWSHIIFWYP